MALGAADFRLTTEGADGDSLNAGGDEEMTDSIVLLAAGVLFIALVLTGIYRAASDLK
jgi:hypothetical protein